MSTRSVQVARYLRWMVENRPGRTSLVILLAMPLFYFAVDTVWRWLWPSRETWTWVTHVYAIASILILIWLGVVVLLLWCVVAWRFWESGAPADDRERHW